jgi:hypothetical protein
MGAELGSAAKLGHVCRVGSSSESSPISQVLLEAVAERIQAPRVVSPAEILVSDYHVCLRLEPAALLAWNPGNDDFFPATGPFNQARQLGLRPLHSDSLHVASL